MPTDPELADELVAAVRQWVAKDVIPHASELEHADTYPEDLVEQRREPAAVLRHLEITRESVNSRCTHRRSVSGSWRTHAPERWSPSITSCTTEG